MKHIQALLMKFVMATVVLYIVDGLIYGDTFGNVLTMGVILTVVAYLLGDLFVLPKSGNMMATASDFILAFIAVWAMGRWLGGPGQYIVPALISAIVIATGEWFFHRYLEKKVLDEEVPNEMEAR
ncbi:YndM family protein [Aneurinibacillus sp. Ricciae_BoGa-3]|uniref:YndM family protein n=1 Tax=Aneurinibacillus sp. Ricciae_BoGa-3 TaxID=3022697 RepID=UPI002340CF0A|nr:YndM family protein [Aneurinibacillus sp. Ricciae_BoGa-3]WCK52685.1 YndM family protein [Aneurinibacillus sp. Ricciae_BoGa-3]